MLKRLKTNAEIMMFAEEFRKKILYCEVPWKYLASGKVYAYMRDGKALAGFAIIPGFSNLRAVQHLPSNVAAAFWTTKYSFKLAEHTAFFCTKELRGFPRSLFAAYCFLMCLFNPNKHFIYSYRFSETYLGKYYGQGDPIKIYSGPLKPLEGYPLDVEPEPEHVEILTKIGMLKIFIRRVFSRWH